MYIVVLFYTVNTGQERTRFSLWIQCINWIIFVFNNCVYSSSGGRSLTPNWLAVVLKQKGQFPSITNQSTSICDGSAPAKDPLNLHQLYHLNNAGISPMKTFYFMPYFSQHVFSLFWQVKNVVPEVIREKVCNRWKTGIFGW